MLQHVTRAPATCAADPAPHQSAPIHTCTHSRAQRRAHGTCQQPAACAAGACRGRSGHDRRGRDRGCQGVRHGGQTPLCIFGFPRAAPGWRVCGAFHGYSCHMGRQPLQIGSSIHQGAAPSSPHEHDTPPRLRPGDPRPRQCSSANASGAAPPTASAPARPALPSRPNPPPPTHSPRTPLLPRPRPRPPASPIYPRPPAPPCAQGWTSWAAPPRP
jgi:hypothetical protein